MSSRMEILGRLHGRRVERPAPPVWRSRRDFDDLLARFTASLEANSGEVHRVEDWEAAVEKSLSLLDELGAGQVVVNGEGRLPEIHFAQRRPQLRWFQLGRDDGDLRAFCAAADVGISGAEAALAETGSLVVYSGAVESRLATLLPPVHLALVSAATLTSDIFTWVAARREIPPAHLTLISGPSKTADIEMTLAVGVHGPKRLIVVLFGQPVD